uniref:Uncharacterized protein n=1 Tax=Triticum urartu TaxID=4572 RepID=A0A8R7R7L9_TRIUA
MCNNRNLEITPGEVSSGESLAPREAEKHQDGGADGGSKPSKVELTEEQKVRTEAFFMPPAFRLLNMEKVSEIPEHTF